MIDFKYNNKIDIECWERITKTNEIFGHKFPDDYIITKDMITEAEKAVVIFSKEWGDRDIGKEIKEIFGKEMPDITCYINTSPYSMDKYPEYISISMNRKKPTISILHEVSHYMFRDRFPNTPDIENVKEIITVINNDVFKVKDYGWKIFKEQRGRALKVWQETKDIEKVIKQI